MQSAARKRNVRNSQRKNQQQHTHNNNNFDMNGAKKKWNLRRTFATSVFSVQPAGTYKILKFHGFFFCAGSIWVFACAYIILEVPMVKQKFRLNHHFLALSFTMNFLVLNLYFLSGIKRGQLHKQIVCMRVYVSCTNWTCLHVSKKNAARPSIMPSFSRLISVTKLWKKS